jgi:hypothetical protein
MFGKVRSAQNWLVEVRMVFWMPLEPLKPSKDIQKHSNAMKKPKAIN